MQVLDGLQRRLALQQHAVREAGAMEFRRSGVQRDVAEGHAPLRPTTHVLDDAAQQIVGLQVIVEAQGRQIAPFFVGAEKIGHEHVVDTALVEVPDERAADETRAAGDENLALGGIKNVHVASGENRLLPV